MNPLPLPVSWLLLLLAVVFAGLRLLQLYWRDARREPARSLIREQLQRLYGQLTQVQTQQGELPVAFNEMPSGWRYRAMPTLDTDHRLLLLHEDGPYQCLPRFPGEEQARTVMFADGRLELFTESAFERLLVGDNVLRGRLGLAELDIQGREE
ncbi:MAG: hypothetical protein HOH74_21500 [Gemmatimonadetes bacterium]|nr:hypothetical protein [Gemmatimonadota bacterium]MBT6148024.1 hypothetical protein [Gemmatimonadota bacterium]